MYSAAADLLQARPVAGATGASTAHPWQTFPVSQVGHHGQSCCEVAREWIVAMDFAQLNGASITTGPRWLREKYEWGPSAWPINWCEIVGRKVIDCGAHSALAHEAFTARGLTALRAQFVQQYSAEALEQWRRKWTDESVSDHWLGEDAIYHEGNALVVDGDELKLWDSSAGWWIDPQQRGGYGSLLAVRLVSEPGEQGANAACHLALRWGDHRVRLDEWYYLDRT